MKISWCSSWRKYEDLTGGGGRNAAVNYMAYWARNLILPNSPTDKKNIELAEPSRYLLGYVKDKKNGQAIALDEGTSLNGMSWMYTRIIEAADKRGETDSGYTYLEWTLSDDGRAVIRIEFTVTDTGEKIPETSTSGYSGVELYNHNFFIYTKYDGNIINGLSTGGTYSVLYYPFVLLSLSKEIDTAPQYLTDYNKLFVDAVHYKDVCYNAKKDEVYNINSVEFVLTEKDSTIYNRYKSFIGAIQAEQALDPYSPDASGQSSPGGGEGDFDDTSDAIDIPALPSLEVTDTGFVGLFTPTLAQLKSLADYMWSDLFSVDTFKKIFADPMDCILGLSIVPVAVSTSTTGTVKVGNISTGVSMNIAASQYVSVDCGTLNINEYWGSFLDYAPHTKAQIYLPYIGVRQIDTDEIMGRAVRIVYHVDILTGACICFITSGGSVLYTFEGACASSIPITGSNFTEMINTIVSIAGAAVATAATGGAAAPTVAAAAGQTATKVTAQIGLSTATNISNMKPTIEHSGSVAGAGALLAVQKPYLIAHRPNQCLPGNQNMFSGYPSYITATLGAQSGFTQIEYINLSGLSATEAETEEIERELKGGVII